MQTCRVNVASTVSGLEWNYLMFYGVWSCLENVLHFDKRNTQLYVRVVTRRLPLHSKQIPSKARWVITVSVCKIPQISRFSLLLLLILWEQRLKNGTCTCAYTPYLKHLPVIPAVILYFWRVKTPSRLSGVGLHSPVSTAGFGIEKQKHEKSLLMWGEKTL